MKNALLMMVGLLVAIGAQAAEKPEVKLAEPVAKGQRIFSTGHSFHNGFPPILNEIAKSGGYADSTIVGISSIGGSKVMQHWPNKAAQAALKAGEVDVLMTTPIYLPDEGIEQFAQLGEEKNPNFRLTLMEFWLPFDNYEPKNYVRTAERIAPPTKVDHNAATGESLLKIHEKYFAEMDDLASVTNKKLGKPVVVVVPVGQAVIALREKIAAKQAAGLTSQEELFTDPLGHPRPVLTIMMAYCHYAVIYRRSPVGLPVPKELAKAKNPEELNKLLQEVAWEAVKGHRLSGVAAAEK